MPDKIYSRCPHCETVFRVSDAMLQKARGKVRCGACLSIFKASAHLVKPKKAAAAQKPVQKATQHKSHAENIESHTFNPANEQVKPPASKKVETSQASSIEQELELIINQYNEPDKQVKQQTKQTPTLKTVKPKPIPATEIEQKKVVEAPIEDSRPTIEEIDLSLDAPEQISNATSKALPEKKQTNKKLKPARRRTHDEEKDEPSLEQDGSIEQLSSALEGESLDPDPLDEFNDIIETKSHKLKWLLVVSLLSVSTTWGIWSLWTDRQKLAWDDTWGPVVQIMCKALPCALKPRRNINAIKLLERSIQPASEDDKLEFDLIIKNNAAFEQPYPVVQITFTDTNGNQVSTEQFQPSDYLSEEMAKRPMPINQRIHIMIRTQNPHPNTFGFEFQFL